METLILREHIHTRDEVDNKIVRLHISEAVDYCREDLYPQCLLYILRCNKETDVKTWEVIGCIYEGEYKYEKNDQGLYITNYYPIPVEIDDETLIDWGRLYFPQYPLQIGEKQYFFNQDGIDEDIVDYKVEIEYFNEDE